MFEPAVVLGAMQWVDMASKADAGENAAHEMSQAVGNLQYRSETRNKAVSKDCVNSRSKPR